MLRIILTLCGLTVLTTAAQADVTFNFNSNPADAMTGTGTTDPSSGTGIASVFGGTTATFATGSPGDPAPVADNSGWNLSTYAAQGTGSGTRGAQFTTSTVGMTNIAVTFDFRQSGTASRFFQLQATTDGTNYNNVSGGTASFGTVNNNTGTTFTSAGLYSNTSSSGSQTFVQSVSYVFANGDAVENNANFGFRFVAVFDPVNGSNYISANAGTVGAYSTGGTTRFDMVQVAAVPEPSSFILGGALCGGLGLRMLRRRKASHAAA